MIGRAQCIRMHPFSKERFPLNLLDATPYNVGSRFARKVVGVGTFFSAAVSALRANSTADNISLQRPLYVMYRRRVTSICRT